MAAALAGCTIARHKPEPPPSADPAETATCVSCGGELSAAAIAYYEGLAADGDPVAALRLAAHYRAVEGSAEQARWLRRATDLEEAHAQYDLGARLADSADCDALRTAQVLLAQAAARDLPAAGKRLREVREKAKACPL